MGAMFCSLHGFNGAVMDLLVFFPGAIMWLLVVRRVVD